LGFIFYDVETTGLNASFDQIIQFAAIKTDSNFNEIDRFEIKSRLLPYVVPSPVAILINGISVRQLTSPDLPSNYEMACKIYEQLSAWGPAIFIGHNSLTFDENFLRHCFYKNLHYPYLTNSNNNCRMDSLKLARAVNIFNPNSISVPLDETGYQTFGLEPLAVANGLKNYIPHEALNDVEAVIHICKVISQTAEDLWSDFIRFSKKSSVIDFVEDNTLFALTEIIKGQNYIWPVAHIGQNPDYGAEMLVFDLCFDPEALFKLDDSQLFANFDSFPKPVRGLRTNASPILSNYEDIPLANRPKNLGEPELQRRGNFVARNEQFKQRLTHAYLATNTPFPTSPHVEAQLHDGFTKDPDKKKLNQFHAQNWEQRSAILLGLEDKRSKILGERLIYTEAPDILHPDAREKFDRAVAQRILSNGKSVPWLTLPEAISEAEQLISTTQNSVLAELVVYLRARECHARSLTN